MPLPSSRLRYEPSPAHKDRPTEVGPPRWNASKEKCPDMTIQERDELLAQSVSVDNDPTAPRRYAVRRAPTGTEFYECKLTRIDADGTILVHGHPTSRFHREYCAGCVTMARSPAQSSNGFVRS